MKRRNFLATGLAAATAAVAGLPKAEAKDVFGYKGPAGPPVDHDALFDRICGPNGFLNPIRFIESTLCAPEPTGSLRSRFLQTPGFRYDYAHYTGSLNPGRMSRATAVQVAAHNYWIGKDRAEQLDKLTAIHGTYGRHVESFVSPGETSVYWVTGPHYGRAIFELENGERFGFVLGDMQSPAWPSLREVSLMPDSAEQPECDVWLHIVGDYVEGYIKAACDWQSPGHSRSEIGYLM